MIATLLLRNLPKVSARNLLQLEVSGQNISKILTPFRAAPSSSALQSQRSTSTTVHVPGAKHNHATHWSLERVVDAALLPVLPVAFFTDGLVANYLLILLTAAHVHWGLEAIVIDYMRPRVVGQVGYYASLGFVYMLSFATLAGLLYLNYSQMPVTKAVKKLWAAL